MLNSLDEREDDELKDDRHIQQDDILHLQDDLLHRQDDEEVQIHDHF